MYLITSRTEQDYYIIDHERTALSPDPRFYLAHPYSCFTQTVTVTHAHPRRFIAPSPSSTTIMPSTKGNPTDPKLHDKITEEIKQQTNKDGEPSSPRLFPVPESRMTID